MIVAGFGFRRAATVESLHDAFCRAVGGHTVTRLTTLTDKADSPAFIELCERLRLAVHAVDADRIADHETTTNSSKVRDIRAVGSVAEATALVAAGPNATLLQTRIVSEDRMATCALAASNNVGDPQ